MELLMDNPAFRTYALCSSILALKMILAAFYTGMQRQLTQGYANPEDARVFGQAGATSSGPPTRGVDHALRIQRNDGENIPSFFAIGLVYVLSGASAVGAAAYFWTFTGARLLHTIAYVWHLQPWRAICFLIGVLCMFGMIAQIVAAAF
jgi:glutathione S-transferase